MSDHLRNAREARNWFFDEGISMTDWAREHGFPRQAVYAVLSGKSRCTRGRGHLIAVALGMKRSAEVTGRRHPPGSPREYQERPEGGSHASSWRAAGPGQQATVSTSEEVSP